MTDTRIKEILKENHIHTPVGNVHEILNYADAYKALQQVRDEMVKEMEDKKESNFRKVLEQTKGFAEWVSEQCMSYDKKSGLWMTTYDDGIHDQFTSDQLLNTYLQQVNKEK